MVEVVEVVSKRQQLKVELITKAKNLLQTFE